MTKHCHNWLDLRASRQLYLNSRGYVVYVRTACGLRRCLDDIARSPAGIECEVCALRLLRSAQAVSVEPNEITWAKLGAMDPATIPSLFDVVSRFRNFSAGQRVQTMVDLRAVFCLACGAEDPSCRCADDE